MKAIIIEDVQEHYEVLLRKLQAVCPHVDVVAWVKTCSEAPATILSVMPDLLFLDIELTDGFGFSILSQISPLKPAVIFVTGYEEHIMRAFQFSAIDFLMKPVDMDKLAEAVDRAQERNRIHLMAEQYSIFEQSQEPAGHPPRIALSNHEVIVFKNLNEIVYLEASAAKTQFYFKDYFIEVNKGLIEYERLFADHRFLMRTSRSHLVNLEEVRHYVRADVALLMSNGKQAFIGENFKQDVLSRLREYCDEEKAVRPRLELPDQKIIAFPYLDEILYLRAEGALTLFFIKTYRRCFTVAVNLGKYDKMPGFRRVHHSYTVNLNEVRHYERSKSALVMSDGESVPVSERNKDDLLRDLGI